MTLRAIASELRLYLANHWIGDIPSHRLRLWFYRHVLAIRIGTDSTILMGCWFDCAGGIEIGSGTTINQRCRLDGRGGIRIGSSVSISANVTLLSADHDPHANDFAGRTGSIAIDDYCFIGTGAIVLRGVRLHRAAVVGAGSVVTRDIPAGEIWAGNPARRITSRRNVQDLNYRVVYRRLFQ